METFKTAGPPDIKMTNSTAILYADVFVNRIEKQLKVFTDSLASDEAYQLYIILQDGSIIDVTNFGYQNPTVVVIDGTNAKKQIVRCLVHLNSFQVIMTKVKKSEITVRQTIGFQKG